MTTVDGQDPAQLPVTVLSGIGPARAERLARLDVRSVRDLLVLVPRGLERQGGRLDAALAAESIGEDASFVGRIRSPRVFRRGPRRSTVSADLEDETGKVRANFFNQPWMYKRLRELSESAEEVHLYGKIVETKGGIALASPRLIDDETRLPAPGTILPIYALTEGIGLGYLRALVRNVAAEYAPCVDDRIAPEALATVGLPPLADALADLHAPASEEAFLLARRRLALERVVLTQALLARSREKTRLGSARRVELSNRELHARKDALPFEPTKGQRAAMRDLVRDLARARPMRRLLQGDVGSGKTLVALFAVSVASAAGGQSALLAPTEVLAEQHFHGLSPWLSSTGLRAALLTGSMDAEERRAVLFALEQGDLDLIVGTHVLFSDEVRFARLDLAIIDEQQRFGVRQKQALLDKGRDVHMLLLTATPIPRTLALSMYGDLDVSTLREKPPGRGEVATRLVPDAKRRAMLAFLGERMAAGEGVFWVCPRIEGEDDDGAPAAERAFGELVDGPLAVHGVELVHGRVACDERVQRIERFRSGDARLLVGTSIVEVGVDVPEATVMVIDGAERFGLAQLHQLRGRVGRGAKPSWCLLFASAKSRDRLRVLLETNDGFEIAEEDLRQRGMGELAGMRQAGRNVEGLDDPDADLELVKLARSLLDRDPSLVARYLERVDGVDAALV